MPKVKVSLWASLSNFLKGSKSSENCSEFSSPTGRVCQVLKIFVHFMRDCEYKDVRLTPSSDVLFQFGVHPGA